MSAAWPALGLALLLAVLGACSTAVGTGAVEPAATGTAMVGDASAAGHDLPGDEVLRPVAGDRVDYSCSTDADCTIKDVGNCCGYYPACVNVESPTFPERVRAACAESGTASICGFPSLRGCECVEGRCAGLSPGPTIRPDAQR